jgi:hypothetical protein
VQACTPYSDTVCAPLPPACLLLGQCQGLGLEDLPRSLDPGVTQLNMSNNVVFAVDVDVVGLYPNVVEADFGGNPGSLTTRTLTNCSANQVANQAWGVCQHGTIPLGTIAGCGLCVCA